MNSYKTLDVWKHAHSAAVRTLRVCDAAYHPRSRALLDQLKRAAVSVEANIVEGYALATPGHVGRHLRIAFGSAAEAECEARLAGEVGYLKAETVSELEELFGRTLRGLRGLLRAKNALSLRTTHDGPRT